MRRASPVGWVSTLRALLGHRRPPWQFRAGALLLAAALTLLTQWWAPGIGAAVEAAAGDLVWRAGAQHSPERRIVVVDIDELSLQQVGPWPWPRAIMAALAARLAEAEVAVSVFDIGFPDGRDGDDELARALGRSTVVLGQVFSLDPAVTPVTGVVAGALRERGCPPFAPQAYGVYGTAPMLLGASPALGHMTPLIEGDGVVRQLPALICYRDAAYPSLGLAALWRVASAGVVSQPGAEQGPLRPDWRWTQADLAAPAAGWFAPAAWLESDTLPGLIVPLDAKGSLRVPYRIARKSFVSVSATEILRGSADPALLRGTIALVGATAFGAGDVVATPLAAIASGLEVHAQVIAGLLDGRLPYTPRYAGVLQGLAAVMASILLLALAGRAGGRAVRRLPLAGLLGAALIWLGAGALLLGANLWLPWVPVALFVLLAASAMAVGEHAQAVLQRERLSAHLGAYLPRPVAQRLMSLEPSGQVQVERRDISVLVSDIRNFSAFAAHRPPEETVALLHAFSTIAVEVVERHGGVVERLAGDVLVAVWNAVSPCVEHPTQAMEAARSLIAATRELLASNHLESDAGPVQPLALGVGLECGMAIVGSFGPARRRAHAALGEPVSVATRIQQMTADLSVPIVLGPRLTSRLPAGSTEPLGDYLLEGLGRHYALYVPVAWADLAPVDPGWASLASASDRPAGASHASSCEQRADDLGGKRWQTSTWRIAATVAPRGSPGGRHRRGR